MGSLSPDILLAKHGLSHKQAAKLLGGLQTFAQGLETFVRQASQGAQAREELLCAIWQGAMRLLGAHLTQAFPGVLEYACAQRDAAVAEAASARAEASQAKQVASKLKTG
jgi:hypothetical protein